VSSRRHLRLVHDASPPERVALEPEPRAEPARDLERCSPFAMTLLGAAALAATLFGAVVTASLWTTLAIGAPSLFAIAGASLWARLSTAAFDRARVPLLAAGANEALARRAKRAWGMRLFAARDVLAERLGCVALAMGDARRARRELARVLAAWDDEDGAPFAARLGYAHACYALGDDVEASWAYQRLLEREGALPRVAVNLAHSLLRGGAAPAVVARAIARAERASPDGEERAVLALLRAHLAARRGRERRVSSALAGPSVASERVQSLRRELWRALGSGGGEGEGRVLALRPKGA
jgi:hypothetical protein